MILPFYDIHFLYNEKPFELVKQLFLITKNIVMKEYCGFQYKLQPCKSFCKSGKLDFYNGGMKTKIVTFSSPKICKFS